MKIRLSESQLKGVIRKSVKRMLNEYRNRFREDLLDKWENETHIPEKIMDMVGTIAEKVGCGIGGEMTVTMRNRGGWPYAFGKGFELSHRTSSMADGPDTDYSDILIKWIKGLGFSIANSYGDNGMDSATNYNDTWWTYEFVYEPSITYAENFYEEYGDEDDYDEEEDDYYSDEGAWW